MLAGAHKTYGLSFMDLRHCHNMVFNLWICATVMKLVKTKILICKIILMVMHLFKDNI